MPKDREGRSIPVLGFKKLGSQSFGVTTASARSVNALVIESDDAAVVSLYATADMFVNFGDNTVVATTNDHFLPANQYMDIKVGHTHIAAITESDTGKLYISERN